jgi:carbonic anhydrase
MLRLGLCLLSAVGTLNAVGSWSDRADAGAWNYDRCSPTGPAGWEGACKAQVQGTPINLCGAQSLAKPTITLSSSYSSNRIMSISNNGATITVAVVSDAPTLQAGTLAATVGRGTNTTAQTWVLAQMHMHWGRTGQTNEGSEHYMQGQRYPLELHLVHYNSIYGSVTSGAAQADGLLVVGVFFDLSTTDLSSIKTIGDNIATATATATNLPNTIQLTELFSSTGDFYSYGGGLTTPTCNEAVTWIVMKDIKPITLVTLAKFWAAAKDTTQTISKFGNYRPLQTIGTRTLYSTNGATAACTAVTEPTFTCTTSAGFLASPSLFQAAILMLVLAVQAH